MIKAYWRRLHQVLNARRYDLVWIENWIPAILERIFLGKRPFRYARHQNPLVRYFLGDKFDRLLASAQAVTTGTRPCKAERRAHVVQIPAVVDIDRSPLMPLPDEPFTICWIGT